MTRPFRWMIAGVLIPAWLAGLTETGTARQSDADITGGDITGVWEGTYVCPQGETAVTVTLERGGSVEHLHGRFEFGSLQGATNAKAGAFAVTGQFDATTRNLTVTPAGWIDQPFGYIEIGFTAVLDPTGQILSGRIDNEHCSTILIQRRVMS